MWRCRVPTDHGIELHELQESLDAIQAREQDAG
jgi:hypothetical protein